MSPTLTRALAPQQEQTAVDLRTPRSTFDSFCRSVLQSQTDRLWGTVHDDLRFLMQRQCYKQGELRFLASLKDLVAGPGGRLSVGQPREIASNTVVCPLLRAGHQVGTACFTFSERSWLLYSLN